MKVRCRMADWCVRMSPDRQCGADKVHDSRDCEPCPFPNTKHAKCVEAYCSFEDTMTHKRRVKELMTVVAAQLVARGHDHDDSKLDEPEKSVFDEMTPKLKGATYGSDEYKGFLEHMKVGLDRHYTNNRHHPEHFEDGMNGMNLVDLIELLADWKAATERHDDGNLAVSILLNMDRERFKMSAWHRDILFITARNLGWWNGVMPEICEKCEKPFVADQDFVVCPKCRENQDGEDKSSGD